MSNIKNKNSKFFVSILIFIIPIILGVIYYNRMPDEMAVHFNLQNVADGFAPKWFALFCIPAFLMLGHIIIIAAINHDPKSSGHSKAVKNIMYFFIPVLSIIMQISFILFGLGKGFNISTIIFALFGVLMIVLGNYLPKSRQNYSIGIKIPWTLASEDNWNKTHLMAGKLWVVCGILMVISALLGYLYLIFIIISVIVIIPCIYSYILYKNQK